MQESTIFIRFYTTLDKMATKLTERNRAEFEGQV